MKVEGLLQQVMEPQIWTKVASAGCTKAILDAIKVLYGRKGKSAHLQNLQKINNLKYISGPMADHINEFHRLIEEANEIGFPLPEATQLVTFIMSLPQEKYALIAAINLDASDVTLGTIQNVLLQAENVQRARTMNEPPKVMAIGHTQRAKFQGSCHNCGKFGHKQVECRLKKPRLPFKRTGSTYVKGARPANKHAGSARTQRRDPVERSDEKQRKVEGTAASLTECNGLTFGAGNCESTIFYLIVGLLSILRIMRD